MTDIETILKSLCAHLNKHLHVSDINDFRAKPKLKYKNKKCIVNGITFDSKKEANRYITLLMLAKEGLIGLLELQVPFELNEGGTHSLKYIADFVYYNQETGERVVEDVKGFKTREYLKKRRLMKTVHKIIIKET